MRASYDHSVAGPFYRRLPVRDFRLASAIESWVHNILDNIFMARKRKNRTHLKGGSASAPGTEQGVPKSFVIKHGQVGSSLAQLVRDVRKVMEPNTATRLRVSVLLFSRI